MHWLGCTLSTSDADTPAIVAVIAVVPTAIPTASPSSSIVATPVLLDAHLTGRPDTDCPELFVARAVNCTLSPTSTEGLPGSTETVATSSPGPVESVLQAASPRRTTRRGVRPLFIAVPVGFRGGAHAETPPACRV